MVGYLDVQSPGAEYMHMNDNYDLTSQIAAMAYSGTYNFSRVLN